MIVDTYNNINNLIDNLQSFVNDSLFPILNKKGLLGRKDCAKIIFEKYKDNSSVLFKILDGVNPKINKDMVYKLMKRELKLL